MTRPRPYSPTPGLMFGMEVEVAEGSRPLASMLYDEGLSGTSDLHDYHCSCDVCDADPDRSTPWTSQEDCSVDGEFISKPLVWGTATADNAISDFARCALASRVRAGFGNGEDTGNHVHVSKAPFLAGELVGRHGLSSDRLLRLFLRYSDHLARVASGNLSSVRHYNSPERSDDRERRLDSPLALGYHSSGSWLQERAHTWEFRLWNSTIAEWRLRLHAGLTVAIAEAALHGVEVTSKTRATFATTVGPYMTPDVLALYMRQVAYAERNSGTLAVPSVHW